MSPDPWHWMYLSGLHAVSLYAAPQSGRSEGTIQWVLPGFESIFVGLQEARAMKGLWNSEKSVDTTYRPALDALSACHPKLLALAFHAVVSEGAALMVSATRDYGAICLTLMNGNDRPKVYCSNVAELQQALGDLCESLNVAVPAELRKPPKS